MMLRTTTTTTSDKTTTRAELIKQIDEQRKQIASYERKLRDVVRAYKGLNAEKDALQATVEALSASDIPSCEPSTSSSEQLSEGNDAQNEPHRNQPKRLSTEERLETLKRSLATLSAEKSRREAAFQADKQALLAENDALKERIEKSANETEAQAEKLEQHMKGLRAKMKRIEEDRERELADHGSVLAEMQQRYAKERANAEQMERQIAELYKKLKQYEEVPMQMESKLSELRGELKAANEEALFWRKKAQKTPTVQMLESELQNLKEENQRELAELKSRISSSVNAERETRLHELEQRLHNLTTNLADLERHRLEEHQKVEELRKKNEMLQVERNELSKELNLHRSQEEFGNVEFFREKFIELAKRLRDCNENVNFYELLSLEEPSHEHQQQQRYEQLKDDFERYKLKAQAVLKCRNIAEDGLDGSGFVSSLPSIRKCSSCASSDAEMAHMRSVIASLHEKMQQLQIDHENARQDHEKQCTRLQAKITEMQASQVNATNELRHQMQQKVSEVEEEMQKQRTRTLEILADKEKELEVTKTILVSIRAQQLNGPDPVDPAQSNASSQLVKFRKSSSKELSDYQGLIKEQRRNSDCYSGAVVAAQRLSDADSYSSFMDDSRKASTSLSTTTFAPLTVSNATEARNIFYEQQLAKREKELRDLRSALEVSESNMRDMQQSSLTKDLQHYEIIEKLKDEIRILEGKLNFYTGDANMEYLRNVFIQLLHCESSSGRRHILKAIGTVLKLSNTEMKSLEKHGYW